MLARIIYTPGLADKLREEFKPAYAKEGAVDVEYVSNNCELMGAVWHETLRTTASAASIRFLKRDFNLNGKLLRKGNRVLIPFRQLHYEKEAFGEDADDFRPERFLLDPALSKSPSLRYFGGGTTQCPGRHMARRFVTIFVSMMLHRFDLELDHPQTFPLAQEESPSLGVVASMGPDLMVKLKPRK
jgi:cytochrome P450